MTADYTLANLTQPSGQPPGRRRRTGLIVALAALGVVLIAALAVTTTLLLTRQGSTTQPAADGAAPTPTWSSVFGNNTEAAQPVTPPTSYSDADELVDWLNREGMPCGGIDHVDRPSIASSMIDCGDTVVAATYEDHAHAIDGFEVLVATSKRLNGPSIYMAIGSNWTVSADEAYARMVAQKLGGDFRSS